MSNTSENTTLKNKLEDIIQSHEENKNRIEILESINSKPKEDLTHDILDRLRKLEDNQRKLMGSPPTNLLKYDKVMRPNPDTFKIYARVEIISYGNENNS